MKFLDGFASIAADYDGFICDLWGVIHDGVNPLEGGTGLPAPDRGGRKARRAADQRAAPRRRHHPPAP